MLDIHLIDENYIVVALIIIFDLLLGLWVYFTNRKSKVNQQFFLLTIFLLLWAVFCYAKSILPQDISLILVRLAYAVVALFFTSFHFFLSNFPKKEKRNSILDKIILSICLFLVLFSFSSLMVESIEIVNEKNIPILGMGRFIYLGLVTGLILFITARFLKKYLKFSKREKLKAQYFLVGFIVFILVNSIFNIAIPLLEGNAQYSCIGNHAAILFLILTAYAITKNELMGTKILMTQVLIIIISIILFLDAILLSNDLTMQILKIGILISFLYFSRGMVESVKKEKKAREKLEDTYKKIDQYIKDLKKINITLKEKNEDLEVLLNISDITAKTLNPKKIAQDVVDSVPKNLGHLKYSASFLVLYNAKTFHTNAYFITELEITKKIREILKKVFGKKSESIGVCTGKNNLMAETIIKKEAQISDKLEDFIAPVVNANVCKIIQKLIKAKSFISIPMFSGGRIIGTIVFVGTKPKKEITKRDEDILFGFSSHIGAAIENAQLYEQTEKQIKALSVLNENLKTANIKMKELMEVKNEFLHITSHQLRTPLTTIRGMISMWYSGDFDHLSPKEKRKMLKRIYVSAERLNNITNDMLDSLELEGGFMKFQFKALSLNNIIKETVDIMKPNFDKKELYLKFDDSIDIPKIEVEPNYIRQVFINTIDNACKYTRKGGVEIDIKKAGKYVEVIIKDTGIGVSEIDQKKIFLKFTRGRKASAENASGSGLGLFIARKIVEAHHGKIEFISKGYMKGSEVKVSLLVKQGK